MYAITAATIAGEGRSDFKLCSEPGVGTYVFEVFHRRRVTSPHPLLPLDFLLQASLVVG